MLLHDRIEAYPTIFRPGLGDMWSRICEFLDRLRGLPSDESFGRRGERAAANYLRRRGYRIVARSSRNLAGELDLVTVDKRTVVFVEVKARTSHQSGHPVEAITPEKERRLTRAALAFLRQHGLLDHPARFDVIAVTWPGDTQPPQIEHFINAFEPVGKWQMFA